jgi:hypothetical protein
MGVMFLIVFHLNCEAIFNGFRGMAEAGRNYYGFVVTHRQLAIGDLHSPCAFDHLNQQVTSSDLGAHSLTFSNAQTFRAFCRLD